MIHKKMTMLSYIKFQFQCFSQGYIQSSELLKKIKKKLRLKSPKKAQLLKVFSFSLPKRSCDFILNFFSPLFPKMRHSISTILVILFCEAQTFWVELHLDAVLEVLQVVFSKLVDIYHKKIKKKNEL